MAPNYSDAKILYSIYKHFPTHQSLGLVNDIEKPVVKMKLRVSKVKPVIGFPFEDVALSTILYKYCAIILYST
jgi:hypothetical protein